MGVGRVFAGLPRLVPVLYRSSAAMIRWLPRFRFPSRVSVIALFLAFYRLTADVTDAGTADRKSREALTVLREECFACHNPEKKKGGLILSTHEDLLKGCDNGPIAIPGKVTESRLLAVLRAEADPHMPPRKQLSDAQIKSVRHWIASGMRWDASAVSEDSATPARFTLQALPSAYRPVLAIALSPDAKRLAIGRGGRIVLHDLTSTNFTVVAAWDVPTDCVRSLAWSPDSQRLVSGGFRQVNVWLATNGTRVLALTNSVVGRVEAVRVSPDGQSLAFGDGEAGRNGFVRIADLASGKIVASWRAHADTVFSLDYSADGQRLLSAGGDKLIKVWDVTSHQELAVLEGHTAQVLSAVFNTNATQVLSGGVDKQIKVWDIATREKIIALGTPLSSITAVAWPGRSASVYALTEAGNVARYSNLKSHSGEQSSATGDESPIGTTAEAGLSLSVSTDGHWVAVGSQDGAVDLWNSEGKRVAHLTAPETRPVAQTGLPTLLLAGQGVRQKSTSSESSSAVPSFARDVLPVLNRAGCSAGACHAKPDGQNGFKLSVFSYDPLHDYAQIVKAARGRRVFPAAPDESLLLKKALGLVPHEGGRRFEPGSEQHRLISRWIRAGMPYALTNESALAGISVFPKEHRYRKGGSQQLRVEAHYTDGSTRDVSRLAAFAENDKEVARVDEQGMVRIGTVTGQGVVVARYMGFVADSQILVPADRVLPESRYAALPRHNFIDELAYAQLRKLGLFPSEPSSDTEFLRRAKLDTIGLLPTPEEVRHFLADTTPDKRQRFIARILDDPAYADYWANKWADLLRPNPDRVGVKSVFTLDQWLRESFQANKPYDQFAREIVLAEGSNHRDGPAVVYRDRREPPELTTMFSQLFLGTRLECAKCHHHPNEKWSQGDFYQFAAFFGQVKQKGAGLSPPISAGTETFYFAPGGSVKHPLTGETMQPRVPDGPLIKLEEEKDPRVYLADWLTSPGNPFFARAAVNRVWANFFGRGLVEPVDDFRISNPCVNPALLDALASDFEAHHYDLKHLIRTILESHLYQLSSIPNDSNLADTRNFSRAYRRRLPAEVLLDVVSDATGVEENFTSVPPGFRAMQTWSYKIESHFLDAFGRPNASSDCPCERDRQLSVVQSLHMMNSGSLQNKLTSPTGRIHRLADSGIPPGEMVTELYLSMLSRSPTDDEMARASAVFTADGANRRTAAEDVAWALLNSPEFIFNH